MCMGTGRNLLESLGRTQSRRSHRSRPVSNSSAARRIRGDFPRTAMAIHNLSPLATGGVWKKTSPGAPPKTCAAVFLQSTVGEAFPAPSFQATRARPRPFELDLISSGRTL
ncbi:MAG: hypothetical protein ACYTFG_17035 [Planctomycetota bacterium]